MIQLVELFSEHNVPYATEGKNCQAGWVNVRCPFCGDTSNHLGACVSTGVFNCWRCGSHAPEQALTALLGLSREAVRAVMSRYGYYNSRVTSSQNTNEVISSRSVEQIKLPYVSMEWMQCHQQYLAARGYNVGEVREQWLVDGFGMTSCIEYDGGKVLDLRYRLFIPVYWEGRLVSWQARTISARERIRYITCPKSAEVRHCKDILYMSPVSPPTDWCVVVEGPTDAWRLGSRAVATLGVSWTYAQMRELAVRYSKVGVVFDHGETARRQAAALVSELGFRGVEAKDLSGWLSVSDPGSLTDSEASVLMNRVSSLFS